MANPCIFCGDTSRRLSREHVFPDWIATVMGVREVQGGNLLYSTDGVTPPVEWHSAPFKTVVKALCEPCNNGWLGVGLEAKIKSILGPMLLGNPTRLKPRDQRLLAFWAVKTALVLDHLTPRSLLVPPAEYGRLRLANQPLDGHVVWLAYQRMPEGTFDFPYAEVSKQPITTIDHPDGMADQIHAAHEAGCHAYRITFSVGCVVFQVFGHDYPFPMKITGLPPVSSVERIWPVTGFFKWPGVYGLDVIRTVPRLHAAFDRPDIAPEGGRAPHD